MDYRNRPARNLRPLIAATPEINSALVYSFVLCSHLTILVMLYGQTYSFNYVQLDDAAYVLDNPAVLSGLTLDSIEWAFKSFHMSNWHPLTWLSHMLDVSLFGIDPGWAHLHNMVLHGINSLLVYAILLRISGSWGKACILSLIFLAHPLHVESVAWIAERKDLLCALFFLLGLLFYDGYRARPTWLGYAGVLLTYILALMAKPMAVTFPVVLLILDFFVYRRHFQVDNKAGSDARIDYSKAIIEKLPLLALSVAMSAVTIAAQNAGKALAHLEVHSISSRYTNATAGYVTYLKQFFLPVDLVAFYPIIQSTSFINLLFPSLILLVLIVLAAIVTPTFPLLTAGLCWYLVTLLPVIGLIQVGSQAHADRYMYLPSIGILIAFIYLLPSRGKKHFQLSRALSIIFIAYLATLSFWQISYWKNQNTLFSRVLEVIGPNYKAHVHLANDYKQRGMLEEARQHGLAALNISPDWPEAYFAMGNIALVGREFLEAEKFYRLALSKGDATVQALTNLGIALAEQGHTIAATKFFEEAIRIAPHLQAPRYNLKRYAAGTTHELAP